MNLNAKSTNMKPRKFKTLWTSLACLVLSVTAYAQCSIHNKPCNKGCIVYTERQDINCLRCLMNEPLNDSIIAAHDSIIMHQHQFIQESNERMIELNEAASNANNEVTRQKKKKKRALIWGGGATGVALFELVLIWVLFK